MTDKTVSVVDAAYADPLDPFAVIDLAMADAHAQRNWAWYDRLAAARSAFAMLRDAALLARQTQRPFADAPLGLGLEYTFESGNLLATEWERRDHVARTKVDNALLAFGL